MSRRRVAVVGSGVAGLTAAWVISKSADVTLFEADARLGGHADTHEVSGIAVDTGFIVHNDRTYPVLLRLFAELGVETRDSEMSMSTRDDETGIEWAGALGPRGLFPTWRSLGNREHLRMIREIPRFHRLARRLVRHPDGDQRTLAEFLDDGGFSAHFRRHFMEPLVAAVWSCDPALALDYPAAYLFTFMDHHGTLRVFGSPQWKTVVGGSGTYVERVAAGLQDVRTDAKVLAVAEHPDRVEVTDSSGAMQSFDAVVIATHPHQALAMLAAPTASQQDVLSAMPYSPNHATLHTDQSLLPRARHARASWNFLRRPGGQSGLTVTYDLSRLQGLDSEKPLLLTLGGSDLVDPDEVLEEMEYEHPLYSPSSVAAQARLGEVHTERISFAGAYFGWGFHEDGARSGRAAAERLGFEWGVSTGVYRTTIRHTRRAPWRRSFEHKSFMWLVDVDDLPTKHGTFEARDHLGDPNRSLRENIEFFLAASGRPFTSGRILLATQPRAWGYCFNPISVWWCLDDSGTLAETVVEVHNTYGDRHAYLLPSGETRAELGKAMYVSPFHGVDGVYTCDAPLPTSAELSIGVALQPENGARFNASVMGQFIDGAERKAAWASLRGAVLIHAHGWWLWLRRLPVRPRPTHHQEGVSR